MSATKELSQEEIKFINAYYRHLTGYCRDCDYKSLGLILHYIHVYSQRIDIADRVQVGQCEVYLHGKSMATFTFDDKLQMPLFSFDSEWEYMADAQSLYLRNISKVYNGDEILALGLNNVDVKILEYPVIDKFIRKNTIGKIVNGEIISQGESFDFNEKWKVQLV